MSKSKQKARRAKVKAAPEPTRRDTLKLARNGAIGIAVLGVAGYFGVNSVGASLAEADLTRVGNGLPSIVQIHDPTCPLCQTMQKQARRALKSHDADNHQYLVANIKTNEGASFAAQFGVPHVSLLLFDAKGEMVEVVRGPIESDALKRAIDAHLAKHGLRG